MRRALSSLAVLVVSALPASAESATLEPVGTFTGPVYVTSDPRDENRLLVVEQRGIVQLRAAGATSPFLDLTGLVLAGGERGLFSVAFAPDYATTGHLYALYTRSGAGADNGDIQLDEFTAAGNAAGVATRRPVLTIDHESQVNHNGGQLAFGPDGYLYISTGDGGGGGDPGENAQNTSSLLGKILRIDPRRYGAAPYYVPPSNPFVGVAGADEVWSYGLRNPWRFSFDRLTGALAIGDVGSAAWEEVDYAPGPLAGRGDNFGWDCREGRHDFEVAGCAGAAFTEPILEYPNPAAGLASVTGGYVVRDPSLGDLYGRYLYADVYAGVVRSLLPGVPNAIGDRSEGLAVTTPVSFGEDRCGRVYVVSLTTGVVSRFVGAAPPDCTNPPGLPPATPDPPAPPRAGTCAGRTATFVAVASQPIGAANADDVIVATDSDDSVRSGPGADRVCGRGGDDVLRGGPGRDVLRGGPGDDVCVGGPGRDRLRSC